MTDAMKFFYRWWASDANLSRGNYDERNRDISSGAFCEGFLSRGEEVHLLQDQIKSLTTEINDMEMELD